jgi:hypothetical protein
MNKVKAFFVALATAIVFAAAWILVVWIRRKDNQNVARALVESNQQGMDQHRQETADRIAQKTEELEHLQIDEIVARFKEKFQ